MKEKKQQELMSHIIKITLANQQVIFVVYETPPEAQEKSPKVVQNAQIMWNLVSYSRRLVKSCGRRTKRNILACA